MGEKTNTLTDYDVKALDDTIEIGIKAVTTNKDVTVNNLGAGQVVKVTNDSAGTLEMGDVAVNLEADGGTADDDSCCPLRLMRIRH